MVCNISVIMGKEPLINGQVGIFFKAFLGYTQNPSLEEFVGYWGYYFLVFILACRSEEASGTGAGTGRESGCVTAAGRISID